MSTIRFIDNKVGYSVMESKPPLHGKPLRRKVHVVYYLSRAGQMDHPHLLEGYLTVAQDGLRLRDFKRWLGALRGKSMPTSFAWSYKRNYKSGFIWHDLGDNDLIQPLCKNEYVLMGSEIFRDLGMAGKCKCESMQQAERQTGDQLDAEVQEACMNSRSTVMSSPKLVNKSTSSSPKLVNKSTSYGIDQPNSIDVLKKSKSLNNSGRLVVSSSESNHRNDGNKSISKGTTNVGQGSSSRSLELTAQRLLEEVKRPTNHITSKRVEVTGSRIYDTIQSGASSSLRECEIIADDQEALVMMELTTDNHIVHQQLHQVGRDQRKGNSTIYMKQASPMYKSRGVCHDSITNSGMADDVDHISGDDEMNCTNSIVDASTQTGDSTRCSTDRQESMSSHCFDNMVEMVGSPAGSNRYSEMGLNGYIMGDGSIIKRVSSAGKPRGNLSKQLSKDMSNLPDLEKAVMINNSSDLSAEINSPSNMLMLNPIGSPALSTCSAMSARSTRFAREENYTRSASKPMKPEHHHHGKGSSNLSTSAPSSAPTLLKQILKCGNADGDVKESKPGTDHVIMNNNALSSAMQTPYRVISTSKYPVVGGDIDMKYKRGGKNSNVWTCKPGMMKRNVSTSSDTRSVISATASDTLEVMSSPDSVHSIGRLKSIMRAKSLVSSVNIAGAARGQQLRLGNTANAAAVTSPCSSTSRRSSIRENDTNISGDMEGLIEGMRAENGETSVMPNMRTNKGNKNTIEAMRGDNGETSVIRNTRTNKGNNNNTVSISGILSGQEVGHGQSREKRMESNSRILQGGNVSSTMVSELHKLICNPSGSTPTPIHDHHCRHTACEGLSNSQSHKLLLTLHPPSTRTPTRRTAATLLLPPSTILSKSLNSPCSSSFLDETSAGRRPSSSYISSWKDLLWSPRYHSSHHKEKDGRRMKP